MMADENRNDVAKDTVSRQAVGNGNDEKLPDNNNFRNSPRKEGLYAKKDNSNYQRFIEYNRTGATKIDTDIDNIESANESLDSKDALLDSNCQNSSEKLTDSKFNSITTLKSPSSPSDSSGIEKDVDDAEMSHHEISKAAKENFNEKFPSRYKNLKMKQRSFDLDYLAARTRPTLHQKNFSLTSNPSDGITPSNPEAESNGTEAAKRRERFRKMQSFDSIRGILLKKQYPEAEIISMPSSPLREKAFLDIPDIPEKDSIDGSDTMLEIYDDDEDGKKKAKIPDGGWGWVVVLSSLIISMIADGVSFSFGLLYIEFLVEFGESKSKTSWIGSLFMAVPLLSGPVMSALVDRYGCRKMTILGGLISGTGFVLSCFANSIEVMYLTFGVIAGLGLGLCYVTAVVSIAFWFDKKRTLAVGLGACGTGIGTFVYAPMTTYFINEYGWRGATLLLAGTFYNMIVCGAVMRDPKWLIEEQKKQQDQSSSPKSPAFTRSGGRTPITPDDDFPGIDEVRNYLKSGQAPQYFMQNLRTSTDMGINQNGNANFRSVVNLPTFVKQSEKVPLEVLESLSSNSRLYNVILENYPSLLLCRSASDKKLSIDLNGDVNNKSGVTMSMRIKQAKDGGKKFPSRPGLGPTRRMSRKDLEEANPLLAKEVAQAMAEAERATSGSRPHVPGCGAGIVRTDSLPWLRRQFSTNTHYFKDIKIHRNSVMYRGAVLNLHKYRLRASSCPNFFRNSMTTLAKENEEKWYSELLDLIKGMADFSMFLEFHFLLLSLSTILLFTWFIVPYFYIAEHLNRHGYEEQVAAKLISFIGITNTIGMIGLGWAGDQPWMNVSKCYAVCLILCGISTILMPFFTDLHFYLYLTAAFFGLFFASSFSFTPVILVELIPLDRFTTAYGLTLLCQGIGNLVGPPLAGWIFDVTGAWDLSFIMAGSWIIFSGILMAIIPFTKNRKIFGSGALEMDKERESA